MDEEIGETQKEVERELRQEMDQALVQINEVFEKWKKIMLQLKIQIKKFDDRADEYEKVILKFRQKVIDLNEEIQDHKDQVKSTMFYKKNLRSSS